MLEGSILQKLKDAHHPDTGKRPLNFGVYYKNTLVALCHALEDAILDADYNPLMIAAFQRGKWYLQEADRYGEIAQTSRQIVIMAAPETGFADHPTSQQDNVALVSLQPSDPVAQEWHLIILSPDYTAMVLCQELSEEDYGAAGVPEVDLERKFYGFWTFEPDLVLETAKLAIAHIQDYHPDLHRHLTTLTQEMAQPIQQEQSLCGQPTVDHLGKIAARVVDYLQTAHDSMLQEHPLLDSNLVSNELQAYLRVAQLLDQTDLSNPMAAAEVASLSEAMGQLLDLPAWQLHRLRLAGLLHRIAVLRQTETILPGGSTARFQDEQPSIPLTCPLVPGIQVLRRMQRLQAVATILMHQTEWWNGSGQPTGLAGDEIPIESRILGLVIAFQHELAHLRSQATHAGSEPTPDTLLSQAFATCQQQQGERWDPKLVDALGLLVSAMRQGVDLPIALPKIASGLWLLDASTVEDMMMTYAEADVLTVGESGSGN